MPQSALHEFIDEEMLRAPMTLDQAIDAVHERWRIASTGRQAHDPARVLQQHRQTVVNQALQALRASVQADLQSGRGTAPSAAPAAGRKSAGLSLSLIDEDDVATDIELNRCIEAVKLRAEAPLRELQTYTSALVNDPNVSRDTNPFRPEVMVRALWDGVQRLPLARSSQAAFMREAAEPLARALALAYGAAVARLDERGITPAAHRTIVFAGGALYGPNAPRYKPPADLNVVRDSLPAPLDALPVRTIVPQMRPEDLPPPGTDPQLIVLLTRLFDEIHADRSLSPELSALLLRLQPSALRVAVHEPTLLDTYDHPVWRFMDTLAHAASVCPPADRLRLMGLGRNLIDHISAADITTTDPYSWAIDRLHARDRHALAQALAAAQPEIDRLRQRAVRSDPSAPPSASMPLDVGTLDTVPADLMPDTQPAALGGTPALSLHPGEHLRAWLQGDWRMLQVLVHDLGDALWVLREPTTDQLWAVRPAALERLVAARLAVPLRQRSLVRRAAERVLRAL